MKSSEARVLPFSHEVPHVVAYVSPDRSEKISEWIVETVKHHMIKRGGFNAARSYLNKVLRKTEQNICHGTPVPQAVRKLRETWGITVPAELVTDEFREEVLSSALAVLNAFN